MAYLNELTNPLNDNTYRCQVVHRILTSICRLDPYFAIAYRFLY